MLDLCENELKKVTKDDNVRLTTDVATYEKAPGEKPFLLQRYETKWHMFVDVIDRSEFGDMGHLKVVPLPGLTPEKVYQPLCIACLLVALKIDTTCT